MPICKDRNTTSVPLQRYSFETVALLKDRLKEWEQKSYASQRLLADTHAR